MVPPMRRMEFVLVLLLVIVLEIAAFDYENEHRFAEHEHGAQSLQQT